MTGSAPKSRMTFAASIADVPRVAVSSVTTTLSPGSSGPAMRPITPWSFASRRMLNVRSSRPRVAPTAAMPKATGSAPCVRPADGRRLRRDDLERRLGDEQDAVGPAHRLLGVDEPVAVLAGLQDEVTGSHGVGTQVLDERITRHDLQTTAGDPPHLHRTPAGRELRRPARRRPPSRGARVRRVLPLRPLPEDGRASRGCPVRPTRGPRSPASPATRAASASARW